MSSVMIPLSTLDPSVVEKYFNERFPDNYSTMNANPNFESSGCGIAVTADDTKKTLTVPNPADTSKALCTVEYSKDSLKFVYPKAKMVGNMIDVGVGSTDKINCLTDTYNKLKPIILNWKNIDFSSLSINDIFYMGKYQVGSETPWDIEWEIVHQESDYQIAMAKQIIDLRCFDAMESNNSDNNRKTSGNNNWGVSNIEQWLNSDQSNWYSAQHSADAPPSSANIWVSNNVAYNPYDTKPGFLYYWTDEEKAVLQDMTLTLANNTITDGGGSYTWTGKVWLPTYTQMSGNQNNSISEGTQFSKFTDNNSRIKTIHAMCAANNQYCIDNGYTEGTAWFYWMSSAFPSYSCNSRRVNSDGNPGRSGAYGGYGGVVPCIRVPR